MKWTFPKQQKESPESFLKKEPTVDQKKIEGKLRRLVDEFGVQPSEAERSVTNELAKGVQPSGMGSSGGKSGGAQTRRRSPRFHPVNGLP